MTTFTPRMKAAIARAEAEADGRPIGTEHMLLSLLEDERGIAAQVLAEVGVAAEVSQRLRTLLASPEYNTPSSELHLPS